ncbi:hypothetical protein BG846_05371 [Streptomyces fradiae ATCC 10745 = DSM 40063]|uniref:Uncharacterized protein n=1 Tax=Streptomyces fradiae ATCC 10745 = DSM 40063 TaxID=1319510 RepID=A0A1Y2NQ13_STRFR|nr:hypothetical protein BG846_05371 [Streptomyces fradiae ATCC 10745 = DSM 40063]
MPEKHSGIWLAYRLNSEVVTKVEWTPCSSTSAPNASASSCCGGATTTLPPFSSGTQISKVAASNACAEWNSVRRWRPSRQRPSTASRVTASWVTPTPFGVPVEPEVNMT